MTYTNKLAVITGASRVWARFLRGGWPRVHDLLLVARSGPELEALPAELCAATDQILVPKVSIESKRPDSSMSYVSQKQDAFSATHGHPQYPALG